MPHALLDIHRHKPLGMPISQPFVTVSTFLSQKLQMIWESKGNEAVMCSWLWRRASIGWAAAQHGHMSSWNSCTPASLAVSRCLGVGCFLFGGATARKSGENLHAPLTGTPMSLRRKVLDVGAWAWWIIDLVANSFSRLTQSPNSSAALLKLNYCTTRWMKCFPKTLAFFHVSLWPCQNKTPAQTNSLPCFKWPVRFSSLAASSSQHSSHREVSTGRLFVLFFALIPTEEMSHSAECALSSSLIPSRLSLHLCCCLSLRAMRLLLGMFGLAMNNSNVSLWKCISSKKELELKISGIQISASKVIYCTT